MLNRIIHCQNRRLPFINDGGVIGFNVEQIILSYGSSDLPGWGAVF